ncbi:MAG TPA: MFS transporter, partial [Leclercia adecarboxylata]|nr:MFS transporter [Leclercia adecarboxylata]
MTDLPANVRWQLWIVAFGFFMQALDTTIVNTALPSMAQSLGESPLHMHMVIVAYVLTVAVMLPASGWLADKVGVRNIFCTAIVLFTAGSLFCARAETLNELVLSRVLQGVGGAMMVPVGRLTVMKIVPRAQYMAAMTFVTLPGQVGPLLGPALGGMLVEYASWHWIFLINLPVGVIGCIAALRFMPDLKGPERVRFDTLGFVLFGAAMVLITIALEGLGEMHMPHARVMLLLFGGAACMAAYWLRAGRIDAPLFSPTLFHTRSFAVGIFGNLFARLGGGALPFLVPLLLQVALGYSPAQAGMSMIPLALGAMAVKSLAKPIIDRLGYRRLLIGNTLLLGGLIASLATI